MFIETVSICVVGGVFVWGLDWFMSLGLFKKEVKNELRIDNKTQNSVLKNKFGQIRASNKNTFSKKNGYKSRSAQVTIRQKELNTPHPVVTNFLNKLHDENKK